MSGLDEKAVLAACEAYHADLPTHDYPSRWAMEQAISAYLAAATPADVGEEPVAWRWKTPAEDDHWVWSYSAVIDNPHDARCEPLYSATALERVVRERDEARADHEWMTANRNKWQDAATIARRRAESAEAKLAEARKVIEPFARAADNAERLAGHDGPLGQCVELEHLRAARRFLEETK